MEPYDAVNQVNYSLYVIELTHFSDRDVECLFILKQRNIIYQIVDIPIAIKGQILKIKNV